ncbi:MAG: hypothetical protein ABWX70_10515 [Hyphomicrobium sp.]
MLRSRSLFPPPSLFLTPKSSVAIPVRDELTHDALCQAALDPAVTSIEFTRSVTVGNQPHRLDGIVLVRDNSREMLDIERGDIRSLDAVGLRLLAAEKLGASPLTLNEGSILREPRCSNARTVWEHHRRPVSLESRIYIADLLDEEGAMSIRDIGIRFREDIFALACGTLLDIELHAGPLDAVLVRPTPRLVPMRPLVVAVR